MNMNELPNVKGRRSGGGGKDGGRGGCPEDARCGGYRLRTRGIAVLGHRNLARHLRTDD